MTKACWLSTVQLLNGELSFTTSRSAKFHFLLFLSLNYRRNALGEFDAEKQVVKSSNK